MPKQMSDFAKEVVAAYKRENGCQDDSNKDIEELFLMDQAKQSSREEYDLTVVEICSKLGIEKRDTCQKIIDRGMQKCLRRIVIANRLVLYQRKYGHIITDEGIDDIIATELSEMIKNKDFSSTVSLFF